MSLAASISATFGPTPRTYITGVSRPGTIWMLQHLSPGWAPALARSILAIAFRPNHIHNSRIAIRAQQTGPRMPSQGETHADRHLHHGRAEEQRQRADAEDLRSSRHG